MPLSPKITLAPQEKSTMELVAKFKGGELLKKNNTLYFNHPSDNTASVYEISLLDFLIDWGNTPYLLSTEQKEIVKEIRVGSFIPIRCAFKNGKSYEYCELLMSAFPPPAHWFVNKQPEWHYITDVVKMDASRQVIPKNVQKEILRVEAHNKKILNQILKLKGNLLDNPEYDKIRKQTITAVAQDKYGNLFKFSQPETIVYSPNIDVPSLTIVQNPTSEQITRATELSLIDYNERGNDKPPFATVYIYADACEL